MFSDLGDQQHVFSQLDEWANSDNGLDLTYLTGSKSTIGNEIARLLQAIQDKELETINKNPSLKIGFSEHSKLLARLLDLLSNADRPSKLLANLPEIRQALLQANTICADMKIDYLKPARYQLDRYRQGRTKDSISLLHKTLATIYKNAGQPSFKGFERAIRSYINEGEAIIDDAVTLQELEEYRLCYLINGKEKNIKLTSIQTKIKVYKKLISENII